VEAYDGEVDTSLVSDISEIAGRGVSGTYSGKKVLAGSLKLLSENGIDAEAVKSAATLVYLGIDGNYAGYILISDTVKEGVPEAIRRMKATGIRETVMLTGDRKATAEAVASEIGIDRVYSDLLPADKVSKVEEILGGGGKVGFVGDGINDAPVLMRADVGFAMGSLGSDAAIEAADIVLMDDDVRKIASVVAIARKTIGIVKANVIFAIGVKLIVLVLGALGIANMWAAVFADVGVAVLAILNSMRTLKAK
jgi:Cd2+/Zn2+-exporting ATPase